MNLLEKLKPEILEAINADAKEYPSYVENLKKELEDNFSWLNLTVNTASNLCTYFGKNLGISELNNCFSDEK